jgi:hypothetical protein
MRRLSRFLAIACLLLGGVFSGGPLLGEEAEGSLEYPVKAALLVNFAKFAEWPADSPQARAATVSICVLGRDPFGEVLEKAVAGRSVGGRPIVIQRQRDVEGLRTCHVVFIANSESGRLAPILRRLADQPVLTVGEWDGFARLGGVIGLIVEDNFARFEVNLGAAQRSGVVLSSKLLGVARVLSIPPAVER